MSESVPLKLLLRFGCLADQGRQAAGIPAGGPNWLDYLTINERNLTEKTEVRLGQGFLRWPVVRVPSVTADYQYVTYPPVSIPLLLGEDEL